MTGPEARISTEAFTSALTTGAGCGFGATTSTLATGADFFFFSSDDEEEEEEEEEDEEDFLSFRTLPSVGALLSRRESASLYVRLKVANITNLEIKTNKFGKMLKITSFDVRLGMNRAGLRLRGGLGLGRGLGVLDAEVSQGVAEGDLTVGFEENLR